MDTVRLPKAKASKATQTFPQPSPFGHLFWFSELSSPASLLLRGYLTLGWYIRDNLDEWSGRFLSFKNSDAGSVRGACTVLSIALSAIDWQSEGPIAVCAAMNSAQTIHDPRKPQAIVAAHLAQQFGFQYVGASFEKSAHKSLHRLTGGAHEREAEVSGKYRLTQKFDARLVLVIDDIVTRGTTTGDIARAIHMHNPKVDVVGIALGKSETAFFAESYDVKLNNNHIPTRWAKIWDKS